MKNYLHLIIWGLSTLVMACNPPAKENVEDAAISIDSLFDQYYQERLQFYPVEATFAGDSRYNDTLPNNITVAYRNRLKAFYQKYKDHLKEYDTNNLTATQQMSYDVLMWECDINLEDLEFKTHLTPINQFYSRNLVMGQLASGVSAQPFETIKDYEDWLSRVDDFVVWCDTAIMNMKKGMTEGYVLPKALIKKVIPQMKSMATGPADAHLFYGPINNMPSDFSESDSTRLSEEYTAMINEQIIPTFSKLADFMENEYLPAGRESTGIAAIPNGEAYYKHQIKTYTTTEKSANEIFELGKSEVERITKEMLHVKEEVGFEGDLKAFFKHLNNLELLTPFHEPEEVLVHFREIHERMKPNLKKLFDKVPKTQFEIRRTEAFREESASAEYNQGSTDGSRPGIFYVPIPDVENYNILSDEDLFLHEAIPGHHYQISLQQENEDLPEFRRTLFYSAFGEGWALYSESLGKELGLYKDPYQYFGMLSAEMHRAIRLVVDAGMHSKGWTREEAIQYSLDHEALSRAGVVAEIERYMAWPGQALSYKIGQLKIIELRNRAEEALGDSFDIKEFHNQILETGCVPLELLEKKMVHWIADESKKAESL